MSALSVGQGGGQAGLGAELLPRMIGGRRVSGALALAFVASTFPTPAAQPAIPAAIARAICGPGSIPETGTQGRVTQADLTKGQGSRCNLEPISHFGTLAGFRTHRYVDKAGHECAYYDSTPYLQTRAPKTVLDSHVAGVQVLDMSDPFHPKGTKRLDTPAMKSPHESLSIHPGRGLLAANLGNLVTAPPFVDVYSLEPDCRYPTLLSTLPIGTLGHEGTFSPDGMTYWVTAPWGGYANQRIGTFAAVDVSDPVLPKVLWTSLSYVPHGLNISDDGNTAYIADASPTRGLTILDVSDIQARKLNPQVHEIGHLTWDTVSIPQTNLPVTINGRAYLVEVDEFTHDTIDNFFFNMSMTRPEDTVGAVRIIDIADQTKPKVVSDIRLAVNQPAARAGEQSSDPGAGTATGYTAHYCAVPTRHEPKLLACTFILSGLRLFDIRDPLHPREIAYFNPDTSSGVPYQAMSGAAFVPERNEVWYTDANYGFYALRVTNGVWPK